MEWFAYSHGVNLCLLEHCCDDLYNRFICLVTTSDKCLTHASYKRTMDTQNMLKLQEKFNYRTSCKIIWKSYATHNSSGFKT